MARYCFLLQVRPELLAEYRERHAAVWPEMLRALHATGWRTTRSSPGRTGCSSATSRPTTSTPRSGAMAATEVNARWQAEMSTLLHRARRPRPDESFELLDEIFHLEDQLARPSTRRAH